MGVDERLLPMNIHFALYDPSCRTASGSYWNWNADAVPLALLEELYFDVLCKNLPERPNDLSRETVWGGAVLWKEWRVVYRFFNGGRDLHGRPGRYVILTGWFKRNEEIDPAVLSFFRQPAFERLAGAAVPLPVPEFEELSEVWNTGAPLEKTFQPNPGGLSYFWPRGSSAENILRDFFSWAERDRQQLKLDIGLQGTNAEFISPPPVLPPVSALEREDVRTFRDRDSIPEIPCETYWNTSRDSRSGKRYGTLAAALLAGLIVGLILGFQSGWSLRESVKYSEKNRSDQRIQKTVDPERNEEGIQQP